MNARAIKSLRTWDRLRAVAAVCDRRAGRLLDSRRGSQTAATAGARGFGLVLGLLLTCFTARAQNDGADAAASNALVEAAASIVSNAIVQLSEAASTNDIASNDVAQAAATTNETNVIDTNSLPLSPQLGPLESRRQWLLRQRAGTPVTNDSGGPNDRAQTNRAAFSIFRPAKPEFTAFKLITDRNIFDPNRVPHRPGSQPKLKIVESFALVGIMSYEKGTFAFFDGNSSEYTKAVKVNDSIAGYKIARIGPNTVNLVAGTNRAELQVGMQLRREESGNWVPSSQTEIYAPNSTSSASTHSDSISNSADNDILERLRKKREQE
jgi:hypothetical protein